MDAHADELPVVVLLHGDDPFAIRKALDGVIQTVEPAELADMNITRLDGRQASEDDLFSAVNAMPFMTNRRLVILTHPFTRVSNDASRKRLQSLLDGLPDTTILVMVVEDTLERGRWKSLPDSHWIRRWIQSAGKKARLQLCQLPTLNSMPRWIVDEARRQGGRFELEAASALVSHVGNNTQMASQEIKKLLIYVDGKRPVEMADVEDLTAQTGQVVVFDMVDALANGNARQAQALLHRLLETEDAFALFAMITRQFRLLIQARELMDEGRGGQVAQALHQVPFVADKLTAQARRFSMAQLSLIYHRLLDIDEATKTSQMPLDLSLDILITNLAR